MTSKGKMPIIVDMKDRDIDAVMDIFKEAEKLHPDHGWYVGINVFSNGRLTYAIETDLTLLALFNYVFTGRNMPGNKDELIALLKEELNDQ